MERKASSTERRSDARRPSKAACHQGLEFRVQVWEFGSWSAARRSLKPPCNPPAPRVGPIRLFQVLFRREMFKD